VKKIERVEDRLIVFGDGEHFIGRVVANLEDEKIPFSDLHIKQPNLEDVFLSLTGRELRE
jgi:hypothetical protein